MSAVETGLPQVNSTVLAYGQTGAGKSWSILGDQKSKDHRGLLPRICEGLFVCLDGEEAAGCKKTKKQ